MVILLRAADLPSDPDRLAALALTLAAENERLRAWVDSLKAMVFGPRSERRPLADAGQGTLDLGDTALCTTAAVVTSDVTASDDRSAPERTPRQPRKPATRNIGALPKHLPRCERVIEPESTACPCCAGAMHRIGEDVSEALDVVPAIYRVLRTVRPKYACRGCESAVVQAKARPRLLDGGLATTALVTEVVVARYAWHMPFHRQARRMAGHGIRLDRSTLAGWAKRAAWWLKPLYLLQLAAIHRQPRVFCDETRMPVLEPGLRHTHTGQFWTHAADDRAWCGPAPPMVGYIYADGRGATHVDKQLGRFEGVLQVDGYGAYKTLAKARPKLNLAFCLAHARRKFMASYKAGSPVAREVLARIAAVYAVEARVRGRPAAERLAARQAESAPIMADLKAYLTARLGELSSGSGLANAVKYTLGHWDGLVRFLADGRLEPDTNIVERSIRPVALGRRNSLFAGSAGGAQTWAILASLVNTAMLSGHDPFGYLHDVLERIVSGRTRTHQLDELLAWNWMPASSDPAASGLGA